MNEDVLTRLKRDVRRFPISAEADIARLAIAEIEKLRAECDAARNNAIDDAAAYIMQQRSIVTTDRQLAEEIRGLKTLQPQPALLENTIARALWKIDCDESAEAYRREGREIPIQWADPWHPSGWGRRQRDNYLKKARIIVSEINAQPQPAPADETPYGESKLCQDDPPKAKWEGSL